MSDVDLTALRATFTAEQTGKLPRVICPACSRGNCNEHQKAKCQECQAYVSPRHIHLDYVGHADVTDRLLDVDPEWDWQPKATDPDADLLKAALASGDPEIVRMVTENAPPKFETDKGGNPVGLWIKLTVGGTTRLGYGSCPSNQTDAEKVLIGDALRNAALRFGVATYLWAKGDRADPAAENATGSGGQSARHGRQAAGDAFKNARPARTPPPAAPPVQTPQPARLAAEDPWSAKIEAVDSTAEADGVNAELKQLYAGGEISTERAAQVKAALDARVAEIRPRRPVQAAPSQPRADVPVSDAEAEFMRDFTARLATAEETKDEAAFLGMRTELARAVAAKKISPPLGNDLVAELNERKAKAMAA